VAERLDGGLEFHVCHGVVSPMSFLVAALIVFTP
jgi:hypothetical protein